MSPIEVTPKGISVKRIYSEGKKKLILETDRPFIVTGKEVVIPIDEFENNSVEVTGIAGQEMIQTIRISPDDSLNCLLFAPSPTDPIYQKVGVTEIEIDNVEYKAIKEQEVVSV